MNISHVSVIGVTVFRKCVIFKLHFLNSKPASSELCEHMLIFVLRLAGEWLESLVL